MSTGTVLFDTFVVKGFAGWVRGWRFTGTKGSTLDLTATGWSGKQEGVSFGAKFNWMM